MPYSLRLCAVTLGGFLGLALAMSEGSAASQAPEQVAGRKTARHDYGRAGQSTMPQSVDLRPLLDGWRLGPRRQGSRGVCSVFAMTGALEFAVAKKQGKGTRLSVEFLNWAANSAGHSNEDGGFFSDLWKGFEVYGICSESDLPYRQEFDPSLQPDATALAEAKKRLSLGLRLNWIKEWDVKTGLTADQLTAIKQTLVCGWPVCGGFRWPKKAEWRKGVLQLAQPEDVFDGHSVLLVGYRDEGDQPGGGVFMVRNSGGDGRDGCIPYKYACEYMNDSVWIDY